MNDTGAEFIPASRCGFTSIAVLPALIGRDWNAVTQAYLRALRPSKVRVVHPGGIETSDARCWRVTVRLTAANRVDSITQEVEVDLPGGVEHGWDLDQQLGRMESVRRFTITRPGRVTVQK